MKRSVVIFALVLALTVIASPAMADPEIICVCCEHCEGICCSSSLAPGTELRLAPWASAGFVVLPVDEEADPAPVCTATDPEVEPLSDVEVDPSA